MGDESTWHEKREEVAGGGREVRRTEHKQDRGTRVHRMEKQPEVKPGGQRRRDAYRAESRSGNRGRGQINKGLDVPGNGFSLLLSSVGTQ